MVLGWLDALRPSKILDLGAGNGALCGHLIDAGYEVIGAEPDSAGVEIARKLCPGVGFYQVGVNDAPESILRDHPDGFDVVVATEVIEHLYVPGLLLSFAKAVLRDEGHILITTPYHGYLKNFALSLCNKWDSHMSPLWDGGHIKLFSRRTMSQLLEQEGFIARRWGGAGRVPYLWKSMIVVAQKG